MKKILDGVGIMLAKEPQFVTDLKLFLSDAIGILIGISFAIGVLFLVIEGIKMYNADENDKKPHIKKIKTIVFVTIGIVIAEAALSWVLSYFIHPTA